MNTKNFIWLIIGFAAVASLLIGFAGAMSDAISYNNADQVLAQIYKAQTDCKADKGFYSERPEAGYGLVKQAMNKSGFDFTIETTDSGFVAYAGRYTLPNDLLNSSDKEFVPLFSIDQDSTFREISR